MHAALIANTAWLDEELPGFGLLVAGLTQAGVTVTRVVPEGFVDEAGDAAGRVTWCDSRFPLLRRMRLGGLAGRLGERGVDLVHALDGRLWEGSAALAERIKAPLLLGASSVLDLPMVDRLTRIGSEQRRVIAVASEPLARAMRGKAGATLSVELIVPGIDTTAAPPVDTATGDAGTEGRALCAVISGDGRADADYAAVFEAARALVRDRAQTQFFLDSQGDEQHELWLLAQRHGLLPNLSMIPRRLGHRELLLRADVLIHPQASGRVRGLTLQAMAGGVPVLARADGWRDDLHEDVTAWLVDRPDAAAWTAALRRWADEPARAGALGTRARQWVRQHRSPAGHVDHLLGVYRQLTAEAIRFPG